MNFVRATSEIIDGRYRILQPLGQGSSGTTYAAEVLATGQAIALKELSLRGLQDWKKIELFEREASILKALNHPAIPQYIDFFQVDTADNRWFYLAQDLADGASLADWVEVGGRVDEAEARRIAAAVLEVLVYLHGLNPPVIHRDIKPQNVIRRDDGHIYLVDFGAVQTVYRNSLSQGSTVVGTYGYMAPEQFRGQAVPATDLYGLGATLLFMLTHQSPADLPQERLRTN
ncbi:MAG: serine/threonine-protein kinase, partial [Nodosilinea sp.]